MVAAICATAFADPRRSSRLVRSPWSVAGSADAAPAAGRTARAPSARALDHGKGQLFREQRIASRPGGDEADGLLVDPGAEDGARDVRRLVRGERRQRDLAGEARAHQARPIGRAIRQEQQDAGAGQALGEGREIRLGGAVDPVHVLDDHHERLARARRHAHADQRIQGPGAHRFRAQACQPIARGPAEQVQEERRPLVGVEVETGERPPHLVGDEIERVHLGDAARGADEVDDGQERRSDAVGHALAREIRHLAGRQALAKLVEQARLADAGLADDPHETALPAHGELQMPGQELQLRGAPDEAGHASAGSKPRALEAGDAIRARGGESRRGHRNQREAPAQERGRLLADGDRAGRGREPLERIERGLLVGDVDEGHLPHLPCGDGGHVDGAAHGGAPIVGAALLGHPLRRQARQRGPDRAILDRLLDAECRDDRRLPQLFDAAAEAPDLVEQLVDRPRALGQAVRAWAMARSTRRKPISRDSERTLIRTGVTGSVRVSAAAGAVAGIGDALGPAAPLRRAAGIEPDGGDPAREPGAVARPSPKRTIRARTVLREMSSATAVREIFQLVRTSAAWRCSLICLCQDSESGDSEAGDGPARS